MKKLLLLTLVLLGGVMQVSAATETTVYYAIPSDVVGTYTVKLNVNRKGNADDWKSYDMTKTDKTFLTYDIYSCEFTDLYDGLGCIQFQLYDGETWKSEEQPFGKKEWTSPSVYNGKMWVYGNSSKNWVPYNYDTDEIVITIHCKKTNSWTPSNGYAFYDGLSSYNQLNGNWPGNSTTVNPNNSDYYDMTITNKITNEVNPFTLKVIFNNGKSTGSVKGEDQTYDIVIGNNPEYWVEDGPTSWEAIQKVKITATKKFSTYCNTNNLDFTGISGLEAYKVSEVTETAAKIAKVGVVPGGQGLVLKKTENIGVATTFEVPIVASAESIAPNALVGVTTDTDITGVAHAYILSGGLFYKSSGGTLAAGKAYLVAAAWDGSSANSFSMIVDDSDTDGIKSIENRELRNENSDYYNLAGQKVGKDYKGIVIVNGKKMLNK